MIKIEEALQIILNHIKEGTKAVVKIEDTFGLVLAEEVRAQSDIPPFDNSAMDGYAVISSDIRNASRERPVMLRLLEDVPAGSIPSRELVKGYATKIMTGAPVPGGADAVIIVEETEERDGTVQCFAGVHPGENVRRSGEDVKKGELVLPGGSHIRPQEMGMLAALGKRKARVIRRPRVAILATGSELVGIDQTPGPGQIRNCNNYSLIGLVKKYGGQPVDCGLARDDARVLRKKLLEASGCDMVITSGGVSVGEHDLVKGVLAELGAEMKFWKVCMKPGKPLAFGIINDKPVFGLPGNPVSVVISFEQFVRPALLKMMGRKNLEKPTITAVLEEAVEKPSDRVHLVRATVIRRNGQYHASPTGPQGSGILKSLVMADGLIVLPKETTRVAAGDRVKVIMLDWNER
jgi:molybdopterin molybdotransferase